MSERGEVRDTYVAALQHDLVSVSADDHLAGVVRRPTPWFHGAVDDNYPALGPPEALLEDAKDREEELKAGGICDAEALNAAWEDVDFADRYLAYLEDSDDAAAAEAALRERLATGEDVVLVCYEGEDKRCHRRLLRERLASGSD